MQPAAVAAPRARRRRRAGAARHHHHAHDRGAPRKRAGQRTSQASRQAVLGARRLPQGVLVIPESVGGRKVTVQEMQQAVAALRLLPAADLALLAKHNIHVHLYPVKGLEDGLLGATTIVQDRDGSPWRPTLIRVAARAGLGGQQATGEIVQHEVGHAIAVLRHQDRSEDAAKAYALKY